MRAAGNSRGARWTTAALALATALTGCADDPPCAERTVDACDGACVRISARRVDVARMCLGPSVAVGCMASMVCPSALGLARDPEGGVWSFFSLCFPTGWSGTTITHAGEAYTSTVPDAWERPCP